MTKSDGPLRERLHALEQMVESLAKDADNQASQFGGVSIKRHVRMAYTTTTTTYPTVGNKFEIIFVDAFFAKSAGQETPTKTDRQTTAREWCLNLADELPPQNTNVEVFETDGNWFTYWRAPAEDQDVACKVKVSATDNQCDYLDVQHYNTFTPSQYESAEDLIIEHGVALDGSPSTEKLWSFIDSDDITGYSGSTDQYMGHKVGESDPTFGHDWFWYTAGHLKVSANDAVYSYLEDKMDDLTVGVFTASKDLGLRQEVVNEGATETVLHYVDTSGIQYHLDTLFQLSARKASGDWAWYSVEGLDSDTFSTGLDLTVQVSTETVAHGEELHLWLPLDAPANFTAAANESLAHPASGGYEWFAYADEATYASSTDQPIHVEFQSSSLQFFLKQDAIPNHTAGNLQVYTHAIDGDMRWDDWFPCQFKISSNDTTCDYFIDQAIDQDTYRTSDDLRVWFQETNDGGDEQFRAHVRYSDPTSWDNTKNQLLAHIATGGFIYYDFGNEATFVDGDDQFISFDIVAGAVVAFLDQSAIPGHNAAVKQQMIHTASSGTGDIEWEDVTAVTDECKVKITTNDTTCGFLFDKVKDTTNTFKPSDDLLVHADVTDASGDENLRLYAPYDLVTGYQAGNNQLMARVASGGFIWWDLANEATFVDGDDQFISFDIVAGDLVAFLDQSAIPGHNAAVKQQMIHTASSGTGDIEWEDVTAVTDECKVKITTNDTTCGFLFDKVKDTTNTFKPSDDLLVHADVTDASGDENLRLYAPYDLVTGYQAGNNQLMARVASGGFAWWDMANEGTYVAGEDQFISFQISAGALTAFLDQSAIPGHTVGVKQQLIHGATADISWEDVVAVTDTCQVKVSINDVSCDYLINQFKDTSVTFRPSDDLLVHANEQSDGGDESVRFFAPYDLITGWTNGNNQLLAKVASGGFNYWDLGNEAIYDADKDAFISFQLSAGVLIAFIDQNTLQGHTAGNQQVLHHAINGDISWLNTSAIVDNCQVKVSSNDASCDYLINQITDTSKTFRPSDDMLIHANEQNDGGDESVRYFAPYDLITGWTNGNNQLVAKVASGGFNYWDLGNEDSYDANVDQFINLQFKSGVLTAFLKQDAVPGHKGATDQWFIHNKLTGDIEWRDIPPQSSEDKFVAVNGDTPGFLETKHADLSLLGFTKPEDILVFSSVVPHPSLPGNALRQFIDSSSIPGYKKSVTFPNLQFLTLHHNAEGISWHDTVDQTADNFTPFEDFIIDVDVQGGFVRWYFDVHRANNYISALPQVLGHGLTGNGPDWWTLRLQRVVIDVVFVPATSTTPARLQKTFLSIPITDNPSLAIPVTIVEYEECP